MKRQYFFVTFLLAFGLFLAVYLPMEILFTIFEAGPYMRLGLIAVLFFADYLTVNYLVNHRWNDRWKREAPELLDVIKAPEPAYVMDEATAKKLEASARKETPKKNVSFFDRLYRSLSPSDDAELPSAELSTAENKKSAETEETPKDAEPKETPKAPSRMRKRMEQESAAQDEKQSEENAAKPVETAKPAERPEKKRNKKNRSKPKHAQQKQKPAEASPEAPKKEESEGGSWMTPLDEMKTEELETAVENAMRQGYNPTSNERNK